MMSSIGCSFLAGSCATQKTKTGAPDCDYVKPLTQCSEDFGYDLSCIAELNLNDIKAR